LLRLEAKEAAMRITSPAFQHEETIPGKYTCKGANVNPPLRIEDVPEGTQSLVLIMDDPDVPKNLRPEGVWDHWLVYNMPADLKVISEGEQPPGLPGQGTAGNLHYSGPCPPPGKTHRYFFSLYALDTKLHLVDEPSKAELMKAMEGHIVGRAILMGRFLVAPQR